MSGLTGYLTIEGTDLSNVFMNIADGASLSANNPFTGANTFSNTGNIYYGSGANLTGISASGATLGANNDFTGTNTFAGLILTAPTILPTTALTYTDTSVGQSFFKVGGNLSGSTSTATPLNASSITLVTPGVYILCGQLLITNNSATLAMTFGNLGVFFNDVSASIPIAKVTLSDVQFGTSNDIYYNSNIGVITAGITNGIRRHTSFVYTSTVASKVVYLNYLCGYTGGGTYTGSSLITATRIA